MQKHVNLVDLVKRFPTNYLIFTFKNWRRYSRERAPRSLGENYSILFIRALIRDPGHVQVRVEHELEAVLHVRAQRHHDSGHGPGRTQVCHAPFC